MSFVKSTLLMINTLFVLMGASMCGFSAYCIAEFEIYGDLMSRDGFLVLAAFGGVVMFIAFVGMAGVMKHNRFLLVLFITIMGMSVVCQFAGAYVTFVWADRLDNVSDNKFKLDFTDPWDVRISNLANCTWNACCLGLSWQNGSSDYLNGFNQSAPCDLQLFTIQPAACLALNELELLDPEHCVDADAFRRGVASYLRGRMGRIGTICVVFVSFEMMALLFSLFIICSHDDDHFDENWGSKSSYVVPVKDDHDHGAFAAWRAQHH